MKFTRISCITNRTPGRRITPPWRLHGKIRVQLPGLPGLIDRVTRLGGSPHLLYKRDQIKMRDCMDWQATPPKRFTSPTWCPPPPLKKALKRETSRNSLVTRFMGEMSVFLFTLVFHCRSFSPVVEAGISHFLSAAIKFSCFSSN